MKLYNTISRSKEEFIPLEKKTVKMYACGPTVYNHAHIGNLRTYISEDILRRYMEYSGYKVDEVMNITDIEDKIIKQAKEEKVVYGVITEKYEKLFLEDLSKLNIETPENLPRATDEIDSMIKLIEGLLDKGFAYKSDDGSIYFAISKYKHYGKLAHLDFSGLKEGARVDQDEYDKENAQDFVLWKAKKEGEPSWPAPFGEGRPGWHIECSAMSMKYLGEQLDIHAGAVDLIFPHHENEIAQSEAYTGKEFVKHWFHGEHLMVNGAKMSKSLGNIYTLEEICKKFKVEPLAFRLLCLSSHYREKLNFTDDSIIQAQNTLDNLRDFTGRISQFEQTPDKDSLETLEESRNLFVTAMDDDLNTPMALATVFNLIKKLNTIFTQESTYFNKTEVLDYFGKIDKVLALNLIQKEEVPNEAMKLLDKYINARANKDYTASDSLRLELKNLGYVAEDYNGKSQLRKI